DWRTRSGYTWPVRTAASKIYYRSAACFRRFRRQTISRRVRGLSRNLFHLAGCVQGTAVLGNPSPRTRARSRNLQRSLEEIDNANIEDCEDEELQEQIKRL